jgi:hypothetical protein
MGGRNLIVGAFYRVQMVPRMTRGIHMLRSVVWNMIAVRNTSPWERATLELVNYSTGNPAG